jgi:hypothetical protein
VKLGRLVADVVPGSDAMMLLGGVLEGASQCFERP